VSDALVAAPPIATPFLDVSGRITAPWVSWLQSISRVLGITNTVAGAGLQSTNNLSDLESKPQARSNLGLGSAALHSATDFDVSGAAAALAATLAPSATTDTTNATNISSGTLATARLPTVPIANGGTGQITAALGLTALGGASLTAANTFTGAQTFSNGTLIHQNPSVTIGTPGYVQYLARTASPYSLRVLFGTDGSGWKYAIGKNQGGTLTDVLTLGDDLSATLAGTVSASGQVTGVGLKTTGGLVLTRVSKTAAYTLTAADYAISADATTAGFTLSLLAAPTDGQYYEVTKVDATANVVTIAGNGHNINGAATKTLTAQWATARLQYDATLGQWIAK
jgi:hypothetical protein